MRILTPVNLQLRLGEHRPLMPEGTRIVLCDYSAEAILARCADLGGRVRTSSARQFTRAFSAAEAEARPTAYVLAWRGCGLGDQLVWAGLLAHIKTRWPHLQITNYCSPRARADLWDGVDKLPFECADDPIPFDSFRWYDLHLIGEGLVEDDAEPDQADIWTVHLRAAGLPADSATVANMRPLVPITAADRTAAMRFLAAVGVAPRSFVLWQVASTTEVRSLAPGHTADCLAALRAALPAAVPILVTGHPSQLSAYGPYPDGVLQVDRLPRIRQVFAVAEQAACIVCPDSVLGHVAGALSVPCVSLWGSFNAADRVASYSSHRPVAGSAPCPRRPCRKHEKPWLSTGCPEHGAGFCRVLASITPADIVAAVKEILS